MIELRNVSKIYEDMGNDVIKNMNLTIHNGEFVFIVGQSGAGKSTLTRLMIAEQKPTSGEVIVNNHRVHELEHGEIPYFRRGIGMVFQDFRLLENKTVYENVAFAMQIVGATNRQVRRKVPDVLSSVGLAAKAKYYPRQLSGGEQQRVAIARALVNNPSVLIADEPTGNLDPVISKEILHMLDEINKNGTTVIVVTHDKDLVNTLQKRVIALDSGRIVSDEERSGYIETAFLS